MTTADDTEASSSKALEERPGPHAGPRPTWAPAAMAFGLTLSFWAVLASGVLLAVGLAVVVASLFVWVEELRHEA